MARSRSSGAGLGSSIVESVPRDSAPPVSIAVTTTEADHRAALEHAVRSSPLWRRARDLRLAPPAFVGIGGVFLGLVQNDGRTAAVAAAVGVAWGAFRWWTMVPRVVKGQLAVMREHTRGETSSAFTVTVIPSGLRFQSDDGESELRWSAIFRVDETTTHVLVILNGGRIVVIPRIGVSPTDLAEFVRQLREGLARGDAPA
jgi:YcxB-like protein